MTAKKSTGAHLFYEPLSDNEVMEPSPNPRATVTVMTDDKEPTAVLYKADGAPLMVPRRTVGFR